MASRYLYALTVIYFFFYHRLSPPYSYHLLQIFLYFNFRGKTSLPPCWSAVFVLKRCITQPPFCRPEEILRWGRPNIFILLILSSPCVSNCVVTFHVFKCTCTLCTQYTLSFSLFVCFFYLEIYLYRLLKPCITSHSAVTFHFFKCIICTQCLLYFSLFF